MANSHMENQEPSPGVIARNLGGRPKGSRDRVPRVRGKATFRELYDNEVEKHAPKIVKAMIRSAIRGDSRAQTDLANRILGKPADQVQLSGPGGTPLVLQAAAPLALALMSTEELRALAGLQVKLGLGQVIDLEPQPANPAPSEHPRARGLNPPDQPGHLPPVPLLLESTSNQVTELPELPTPEGHQVTQLEDQPDHHNPTPPPQPAAGGNEAQPVNIEAGEPVAASHTPAGAPPQVAPPLAGPAQLDPQDARPSAASPDTVP